jgi:hypothetical protein
MNENQMQGGLRLAALALNSNNKETTLSWRNS